MKTTVKKLLKKAEALSAPIVAYWPVEQMPSLLARLHRINVPGMVRANPERSPQGGTNINVVLSLIKKTLDLPGEIAECGVFRGETFVSVALFLKQSKIQKHLWGFDSFTGFDESIEVDLKLGGADTWGKKVGGFNDTSYEGLKEKLSRLGLEAQATLVPGYFEKTLHRVQDKKFSFVYLDCDIYQSYKTTLEFFCPRMVPGGIILLDEYNDPPWPGCNKAVDEFLAGKAEKLVELEMDNHLKYFIQYSGAI